MLSAFLAKIEKTAPWEMYRRVPICMLFYSGQDFVRICGLDFERRGWSTFDNNTPYVDGSVTNYGSSKHDAVLGVSPDRLPSHTLNFLDPFACPSTTGVVHATTAKINILEIKYERDSAVPRAPSYTSEDSKFHSSAHTHRGREKYL